MTKHTALSALAGAAILATISVTPAASLTVTGNTLGPVSLGPVLAPDIITGNVQLNIIGNDLPNDPPGSTAPFARTPFENTPLENTAPYNSVSSGATATYHFGPRSSLSLLWGSPDDYNHIDFFLGGSLLDTVSGDNPMIVPPGVAGLGFVNVTITGIKFDKIVLRSVGSDAFEYANLSAIPLPAAAWMMLSALAGLGFVARRKKAAA